MSALTVPFQQFNSKNDDWTLYNEQLQQYFKVNGTRNENRVATLLSLVPSETYKLLRDLCHPVLPCDKEYEELSKLLVQQFCPKTTIWRERIKFHQAQQTHEETVAEWYARVRSLAVNCKFEDNLVLFLKEKFVTGMKSGPILDRLCEEDEKTKIEKLVEIAIKKENDKSERETVNFVKRQRRDNFKVRKSEGQNSRHPTFKEDRQCAGASGRNGSINRRSRGEDMSRIHRKMAPRNYENDSCNVCGYKHKGMCRYAHYNCSICKKKGHLAKVCNRKSIYFVNNVPNQIVRK